MMITCSEFVGYIFASVLVSITITVILLWFRYIMGKEESCQTNGEGK